MIKDGKMKMNIQSVKEITLRVGLEMPLMYEHALRYNNQFVDELANGVGSETSFFYHVTPDTIWFLNINPASHIHDWDYSIPFTFKTYEEGMKYFHAANLRFKNNCYKLIDDKENSSCLRTVRKWRVDLYFKILEGDSGRLAFWSHKILPSDIPNEIKAATDQYEGVIDRYNQIYNILLLEMR